MDSSVIITENYRNHQGGYSCESDPLSLGVAVDARWSSCSLKAVVTESWNGGGDRDLCRSSGPTPMPKQGHLEQAAQDLVQAGFEYLQRKRLSATHGCRYRCLPKSSWGGSFMWRDRF